MIQSRSILNIADNSGAVKVRCIKILGGTKHRYAHIGDIVIGSVIEAEPRKAVKKKDLVKALVVRQKQFFRRKDGSYIGFSDNSAVLIDGQEPRGSRIFGPVTKELRELGYAKIVSMATEVL